MTIKTRAMLLIFIVMLSLSAVFLFAGQLFQKKYVNYSFRRFDLQLQHAYREGLKDIYRKYSGYAEKLINDESAMEALYSSERKDLLLEVLPYYRKWRSENPHMRVLHFIDPSNTTVLRMHKPDMFGDNLTEIRPLMAEANKKRELATGFEVGRNGVFFRLDVPSFYKGKYAAITEFGISSEMLTDTISTNLGFKSAIYIKSESLKNTRTAHKYQKMGDYTLVTYNDPVFESLGKTYKPAAGTIMEKHADRYYSLHTGLTLKNHRGEAVAWLVVAQDVTSEMLDFRRAQMYLVLVVFTFMVAAAVILNYSFQGMLRAIEEGKRSLSRQQRTDTLTSLPNRNALIKDLDSSVNPVLILINIDRFKDINEVFGIGAGDHVLKVYSERILNYLQELAEKDPTVPVAGVLYRLGRDEFVIFMDRLDGIEENIADYISMRTDAEPVEYQGIEISLSVSIGVAKQRDKLLQCADTALKYSRDRNRSYAVFDETMEFSQHQTNNFFWINKVKQSVKEDRIVPYYQPIMDNKTGRIEKYECLLRMLEPDGNVVSPGLFLPIIKKTRLYPELTKIMIGKSVRYFKGTDYEFSINISTEDILNKDIVNFVRNTLTSVSYGGNMTFEILETENIGNYEDVSSFIREVKGLGCRVAIDDFGTGYSNFTHLMNLDFDYIKIDGSLIQNMIHDDHAQRLVKSIIGFAESMEISTVAEFVSSEDIQKVAEELGIDYSQGYFIGRPEKTAGI
ncbi:bifunctional diguanylate cyclase/phosphodiesterase [Limisalsivibrio acetivorans]|uniref:bifunctional diguanylate cyclase/phosphodiesterase n=1 Tax=Limisalsivibrio acetivorans TaxID=1304888 RepID=UPI0003B7BC0F|nr:EAL domain-containing protein [Limisalsivibrio acetivorans]